MAPPPSAITDAIPPVIAVATLAPGALVAGRYRLEAQLGAGGGGTVWRCIDEKLGATVALKIVSAGADLERWRREVAMARRIAHRNVCRVHDLGDTAELRYVTMELVEGDSLRARISGELAAGAARDLFAQVVAGTAAMHAAGVVHRDLKPENIVVARDGRAVIVDFGLAREPREPRPSGTPADGAAPPDGAGAVTVQLRGPSEPSPSPPASGTVTHAGTVVGTPRYMSPEQAAGEPVDARADVWALGLVGHELLTGALPPPDDRGRRIDPAADVKWPGAAAVLRRCLAFLPEERFADARALEQALAALGRRRRRFTRWMLAASVVAAAGGGMFAVRAATRHEPSHPSAPPRMHPLTTTEPKKWPGDAPISVALSPDAHRFAYTTADPRLLVREVDGGAPIAWSIPSLEKPRTRPADPPDSTLVAMWVVGWFSDGSIALVGSSRDGEYQLDRVYPDGRAQLLYRNPRRFIAAATPAGDRIAIAINEQAVNILPAIEGATPDPIATLAHGEQVTALAWSPDGTRIAVARLPAEAGQDAAIQVMSAAGKDVADVWHGALTSFMGQLLAWVDDDRLALATSDLVTGRSQLFTLDVDSRVAKLRDDWPGTYTGAGSAARGTLLLLRGTATYAVQLGDRTGWRLARLHDPGVRARHVAGWTSDGHVVFAAGAPGKERIVRAVPGQALDSWPGTHDGVEVPDTLAGDDVITHRLDEAARQIVIERFTPAGEHSELARLPARPTGGAIVRCAGDRAAPCILEETDGRLVSWTEFDLETRARGVRIHQRPVRDRLVHGAALSPDGRLLAIVDGGDTVTVIDRATGQPDSRSAGPGAALSSVGFAPDGDLWATATGFKGKLSGLLSFDRLTSGRLSSLPSSRGNARTDALRWFEHPSPGPDGKQIAVGTLELALDVWRADGL